ncbi:MAG: hypothetical protein II075_00960 [Bacteroidales bacterium]|jgi:hypothetical protein|nr:hypothetical protein [Bacteroidales bacterium]
MKALYYIIVVAAVMVMMTACTTPINVITAHPNFFDGRKVTVKGKVINTLHLDDLSFFVIKSGQSKLNIITDDFLPVVGDNVKVHGVVIPKFYYQRDSILVVKEQVKPRDLKSFNNVVK